MDIYHITLSLGHKYYSGIPHPSIVGIWELPPRHIAMHKQIVITDPYYIIPQLFAIDNFPIVYLSVLPQYEINYYSLV